MGNAFLHGFGGGSSGTELNYRVMACAEGELPGSAEENTIAVITETAVTSHIFSPKEPVAPSEGMVWILTGTRSSGAFSATKTDPIMLYPLEVWQYTNGVWTERMAKIFLNNTWILWWNGQLYTPGNEWEDITGGWVGMEMLASDSSSADAAEPVITRGTASIKVDSTSGGSAFYSAEKIDLTDYSTLTFAGNFTRGGSLERNVLVACWEEMGKYYYAGAAVSKSLSGTSGTQLQLDISALTGKYYVGIGLTASSAEITSCILS